MKNLMMKSIIMLIMTMARRMGTKEATVVIAMSVEKVVLVDLWLVAVVMLPLLVMGMADLIMFSMNKCITKRNQSRKVPTNK
jgi:hypothetical protein